MDVGRLCGLRGAEANAAHQRVAEYVKTICMQYHGMGFAAREDGLLNGRFRRSSSLADVRCTEEKRRAVEEFLVLAEEELPGMP